MTRRIRQLHTAGREMIVTTTLAPEGTSTSPFMWLVMGQLTGCKGAEDGGQCAAAASKPKPFVKPKQQQAVRGPW